MKTKITIELENDLLQYLMQYFGKKGDYASLITKSLVAFRQKTDNVDAHIEALSKEPIYTPENLSKYAVDYRMLEGKWMGDESIEELINALSVSSRLDNG